MGRTKQSSFWSSRRRASSAPATPRPEPATADPPIGCMSMVHYLIFAPGAGCVGRPPASSNAIVTPHGSDLHSPDRSNGRSKSGFEAPRNSLDLDADNPNDIQIGVQIEPVFDALARTDTRRAKPTAPSSEAETPRTPSLVARLMGIDGLPEQPSPSPGQHHHKTRPAATRPSMTSKENTHCGSAPGKGEKKKRVIPESMNRREPLRSLSCNVAAGEARSLPDTPRGSCTSARASWDGPRLSLQALKESVLDRAAQYMSMPSSPTSADAGGGRKKKKERERAAKEHAREILRQAKENVATRKSKSSSSPAAEKKRHNSGFSNKENVVVAAPVVVEDKLVVVVQAAAKPATVAGKAYQAGTAEHPAAPPSHNNNNPRVLLAPRQLQAPPPPQRAKPSRPPPPPPPLDPPARARKPDGCERFATRIKKPAASAAGGHPPPPASPAVALPSSSTPATSASSLGSERVVQAPPSVPVDEDPEYKYLRTVLERGGFMRSSQPRRPGRQGYSAASPVDPIVFHLLELELPAEESRLGPLRHRWNRKLLFHLAQELLADLVPVPQQDTSSSSSAAASGTTTGRLAPLTTLTGAPLLGKVWRKVRAFPAADCRVVGDIDALVAADLEGSSSPPGRWRRLAEHPAVAEEVADRVLEELLAECVVAEDSVSLS